ncbi:hypothetical protein FAZ95_18120 [Trinickia violacea]|uniref:Uncharacterized protein n=1 Tax=Trinickia violacea TaxID=2571746 RepID=A0A4P8IU60_9BURK|nr:hypothetical protein [Trinickia violacea]QCP50893.1 hypothetical protein FAZ95_18120 [Trinickia violacea]
MSELITPNTLKELIEANTAFGAVVHGEKGGYVVIVKYGAVERTVAARSNKGELSIRVFATLDSVDNFLRTRVHLTHYEVDSGGFEPAERKTRYAPASARMKRAHEAAEHDKWFREQVQRGLDDPHPGIANEDVRTDFAERRAALRKLIGDELGKKD